MPDVFFEPDSLPDSLDGFDEAPTPLQRHDRYRRRHTWYLSEAQTLVRELQEVVWPMGWHIALGGGVLNHGYSNKDLDLYVLPIYRAGTQDERAVLAAIASYLSPDTLPADSFESMIPESLVGADEHECFKYSVRVPAYGERGQVELFVVRRHP